MINKLSGGRGPLSHMLNSIIPNGTDRVMMTIGGAIGAAFSFAFGDVKPLLIWLCVFVTIDMFTGMLAAIRLQEWSSSKIFYGSIRKILMFTIIALAHGLDETLKGVIDFQFVQSVTIVAYAAGEFGSILRNLERAGLGGIVPPVLRYILYAINQYLDEKVAKTLPIKLNAPKEKE